MPDLLPDSPRHGDYGHVCHEACAVWRPRPYRLTPVHFPEWAHFEQTVEREIARDPDESAAFIGILNTTYLPDVLVRDWRKVADALDWPLGRVLGLLAILGARALCEQADRAARG